MNAYDIAQSRRREAGIALLIAIFVLLLVCVVGIAMMVASGTETALTGNYHSATAVYYAALAGLEEGRGRLSPKNPNYINTAVPGFLPLPGTPLPIGKVLYIENPLPGETVNPTSSGTPATYQDTEYDMEFAPTSSLASATIFTAPSVSTVAGIQGPLFKWVRINAITEKSINIDVNHDGTYDDDIPLYYDGSNLNLTSTGLQALEVTSLAAYPNGSQKILQYVVAPTTLNLSFPAAVTLDGNNVQFAGPSSTAFNVDGTDHDTVGSCSPGATSVYAIGYTNTSDSSYSNINSGYVQTNKSHYTGYGGAIPNVNSVTLPANLLSVSGLNALVQTITQNADAVVNGPVTQSDSTSIMPAAMSSSNPVIVVVNGDLTINAWHSTGYGILLVTGTLTYDPDAYWDGIVLVIGKGYLYSHQFGSGRFDGAVFLATTVDSAGNPLAPTAPLGSPFFNFISTAGGAGVYYSSCWIKAVQPVLAYQVLSFHEIPE